METVENKPLLKDYKMIMHISMDKQHQAKHIGTIVWEGNPIDGKELCSETITKKLRNGDFGKSSSIYYLNETNSPTFKTMKEFMNHYKS